jgi:hypothetical protein
MKAEIKGTVFFIAPTEKISDKFTKREIVIKTADTYPQLISVQLTQDKCTLANGLKVGMPITASVNINGRSWENKAKGILQYFNTLECWKLSAEPMPECSTQDEEMPF